MKSADCNPDTLQELTPQSSRDYRLVTTETITTEAGFRGLRQEWTELLEDSSTGGLFLSWEWLHTWWLHLADDRALHLITARHDGRLIAIAPLAYRPRRFLRLLPFPVLEFLGSGHVGSDYLNILVHDGYEEEALRAIAGCLTETNTVLELSQVERMTSQMIEVALQLRKLGWHTHRNTVNFCPYIVLAGQNWNSYLDSLGSAHRTNFRRRLKKLTTSFKVRIEQALTETERVKALAILVKLHLKRWRLRGGSDALHTRELIAFHEDMSRTALSQNRLRLYVMWLDDVAVASIYGFCFNGVFYFYQSGFDVRYSHYSVGLVMLGLVIEKAIAEGIQEFDLLHGEENYKYLWASEERELVRFDMFPPHTRGSILSQMMLIRRNIKRLIWQWLPSRYSERLALGRRNEPGLNSTRSTDPSSEK